MHFIIVATVGKESIQGMIQFRQASLSKINTILGI